MNTILIKDRDRSDNYIYGVFVTSLESEEVQNLINAYILDHPSDYDEDGLRETLKPFGMFVGFDICEF